MTWDRAPAAAVLDAGSRTARLTFSRAAAAQFPAATRSFLPTVLVLLLRRAGLHHVHAGSLVDPTGRGWLIAGNERAGKSTTVALLATRGWSVGGDDAALLTGTSDGIVARSFREPFSLREGGRELLRRSGAPVAPDAIIWPETLGARWVAEVRPDVLLFPTIGDRTSVVPSSPQWALAQLVRWSAWVLVEPDLADEHLAVLTALAGQARPFTVVLGEDFVEQPERLIDLVNR